jgi:hypothetical protein
VSAYPVLAAASPLKLDEYQPSGTASWILLHDIVQRKVNTSARRTLMADLNILCVARLVLALFDEAHINATPFLNVFPVGASDTTVLFSVLFSHKDFYYVE